MADLNDIRTAEAEAALLTKEFIDTRPQTITLMIKRCHLHCKPVPLVGASASLLPNPGFRSMLGVALRQMRALPHPSPTSSSSVGPVFQVFGMDSDGN